MARLWMLCMSAAILVAIGYSPLHATPPVDQSVTRVSRPITSEEVATAVDRGFAVLRKGVQNYPEHRDCFSCHHQALPLMACSLDGRREPVEDPSKFMESETAQKIIKFTEDSFSPKNALMRQGSGVGGRALTVAYGLWTLDLGGVSRNETSDAMVEYLLKTQAEDGGWEFQSHRPPAASSRAMTTAISIYGLRAYAFDADDARLMQVMEKAQAFASQHELAGSHEELIGALWLDRMLVNEPEFCNDASMSRLGERKKELWNRQQSDGGWAQTPDMTSDAYATGQALLMLTQLGDADKVHADERFKNGIRFLLRSQEPDGSWHVVTRSKPVQVYFDNGDPHGHDQFISMMATSWSTAAIANYQATGHQPLESLQVAKRMQTKPVLDRDP